MSPRVEVRSALGDFSLVLRAGAHLCALDLAHVLETMRPLPVEPVAGVPEFVTGVSVIRGEPVPVVDVAALIGGKRRVVTRFVTADGGRQSVALAVEAVLGVRPFPLELRRTLPPLLRGAGADVVAAVAMADAEPLLVLRSARIVPDEVWAAIETAAAKR